MNQMNIMKEHRTFLWVFAVLLAFSDGILLLQSLHFCNHVNMIEGGIKDCAIFLFFPSPKLQNSTTKKFLNIKLLSII